MQGGALWATKLTYQFFFGNGDHEIVVDLLILLVWQCLQRCKDGCHQVTASKDILLVVCFL